MPIPSSPVIMPRVLHARMFGAALTPRSARDLSEVHAGLKIERPLRGLKNSRPDSVHFLYDGRP